MKILHGELKSPVNFKCFLYLSLLLFSTAVNASVPYEHPKLHFKIHFPTNWELDESGPNGVAARAPKGISTIMVTGNRNGIAAKTANEWLENSMKINAGLYKNYRVLKRRNIKIHNVKGIRVDFIFEDPFIHQSIKGWRIVLLNNDFVNEVAFQASATDFKLNIKAVEASLKTFEPSFVKTN